jgi:hypothetical protein
MRDHFNRQLSVTRFHACQMADAVCDSQQLSAKMNS